MRAVWSFWTKPFNVHRHSVWASARHHMLSWVLSVETARQHYPETCLVTDDAGARLLVDELRLPFTSVSTALNTLTEHDPGWWSLGKLSAYLLQDKPFIHIDSDAYLWKRLPEELEQARIFSQSPEPISPGSTLAQVYQAAAFERLLQNPGRGWLPDAWHWYRHSNLPQRAECCGLFGGNDIEFIHHYAQTAKKIIEDPSNAEALKQTGDKMTQMVLIEQYLLSACVEYHRQKQDSPFKEIRMSYLLDQMEHFGNPVHLAQFGYSHLISDAKRNPILADRLMRRVKRDYPDYYDRCMRMPMRIST